MSGRLPTPGPDQRSRDPGFAVRLTGRLLRVPLFYKILVANAGIIVVFSLLGIWLVSRIGDPELVGPLLAVAVAGAVVSVAVNAHFPLRPGREAGIPSPRA